ncbi:uncharacterized protein KRP23_14173 [Phytophthora ramorum]|uniref:uncharacterized protein n=1 Tax=Phytophthora ramorum TaxID=164328 RepID=UPI00309EB95B|nr:hypothetical protein KRP23_14173 [Phytophthora ramorum]
MQALPVGSSRMAPLLQAASLPSEPYSAPHTIRTIRLPSLAPRLPALPSLMSTLAAQGGYPSSATTSPSRTQSSISFLLNPPARQVLNAPHQHHQLNHIQQQQQQQQQYAPVASAGTAPSSIMYHPYANSPSSMPMPTSMLQPQETKPQPKKKRKTRICKSEGCENLPDDRTRRVHSTVPALETPMHMRLCFSGSLASSVFRIAGDVLPTPSRRQTSRHRVKTSTSWALSAQTHDEHILPLLETAAKGQCSWSDKRGQAKEKWLAAPAHDAAGLASSFPLH